MFQKIKFSGFYGTDYKNHVQTEVSWIDQQQHGQAHQSHALHYEEGFTCWKCSKVYKRETDMRRHAKHECGRLGKHKCIYCPYRNHRRTNLRSHVRAKHSKAINA